ncbi:MAG: FAD-binding oxidoreductase [Rhodobacteraceae bacterium]|jgi:glycine/D-amino acid oxidase-like deaminating enzyme|nr:FAD-binding oxidoreductase [Paracoccaceae bacterium]
MRPDVLVIGGGITGLMAAIRLAEGGARVAVVDAGQNAGTWANAGSLHVQMQSRFIRMYPDQVPRLEAALPLYAAAAREWARLEAEVGAFELVTNGGLMLAEGADQMAFLTQKARREEARGLQVEMLDRAALDRIAPWLGPQITGAELCRDEGKMNPLLANARVRDRALALGVEIRRDRIAGVEVHATHVTAHGAARHEGHEAVIAAAWGAGDLTGTMGLALPTRAEPLHMNITEAARPLIGHLVQHAERSITLKQLGAGQIVIGGGWSALDRGPATPPAVRAGSFLGNVALAARLVPGIGGLRVIRTWAGMNTTTDGASIIGRLPGHPRVVMAVPGDAGYTLGPLVARMAAGVLAGGQGADHDAAPYSPARFAG